MINIKNLPKHLVLQALYNDAKPVGKGHDHYDPKPMTEAEAKDHWDKYPGTLDYLKGRFMKVRILEDEFDEERYDSENGFGTAAAAIDRIRPVAK